MPSPTQVLLWADDGAGKFSTSVALSKELCDGQWHQLAGELGPVPGPEILLTPAALLLQQQSLEGTRRPNPGWALALLLPVQPQGACVPQ